MIESIRCLLAGLLAGLGALLLLLAASGCGGESSEPEGAAGPDTAAAADAGPEPVVRTTFYPTTYFAERISGGLVPVECPLPEGADPIFWTPSREALQAYQEATLIIVNGADFEKWVATASLPWSRTVDTAAAFEDRFLTFESAITHSHGTAGEHVHEGIDGHVWLDPNLAKIQAGEILKAMSRAFPDHADAFAVNARDLMNDLDALDARFRTVSDGLDGVRLLASHPAYDYVARRYGWEIRNFDLDPVSPLETDEAVELAEVVGEIENDARIVMLWESEPLPAIRGGLEDVHGIASVRFSPAETKPGEGADYLDVMHANLDRLAAAIGTDGTEG